jgi:hypothetical protein
MKFIEIGMALALLACVGSPAHAGKDPCQIISPSQLEELGLSGAKASLIPAAIDGKQFGLEGELTGFSCEFKKDNGDKIKLISVFDVVGEQDQVKLANHFGSLAKDKSSHAEAAAAQNTIHVKNGICEGVYFLNSQLSVCTGLLPKAVMIIAFGEDNFVGKAWPPIKAAKTFNEAAKTWARFTE